MFERRQSVDVCEPTGDHNVLYGSELSRGYIVRGVKLVQLLHDSTWKEWVDHALTSSSPGSPQGGHTFYNSIPYYLTGREGVAVTKRMRLHVFFRIYAGSSTDPAADSDERLVSVHCAVQLRGRDASLGLPKFYSFQDRTFFHLCTVDADSSMRGVVTRLRQLVYGLSA